MIRESYVSSRKSGIRVKDEFSRHKPGSSMQSGKTNAFSRDSPDNMKKFNSIELKKGLKIQTGKDNCKSLSSIGVVPVKTADFFGKTGFGMFRDVGGRNNHSMKNLIIQFNSRIVSERKKRVYCNSLRLNDLEGYGKGNKGKPSEKLDIFIVSQRNPKSHLNSY